MTQAPPGLSSAEAEARFRASGPNELRAPPPPSAARVLVRQLTNSMVALLAGAAAISLVIGDALDAAVIAAIVVGNAALGFFQEKRADEAARAVRGLLAPTAVVIRDGAAQLVEARRLVVDDVVTLRAGDRVPADGRIVTAKAVQLDESALTGESLPVDRDEGETVLTGTTVTHGEGRMVVAATGEDTELGRIAEAGSAQPPRTPLQVRLDHLTLDLVRMAIGVCLLLGVLAAIEGAGWGESALIGISLAVAAVPEGLPAVVTISLALGVRRLAESRAIVRRLPAVETLGCTDVICTDKTGTLTANRLSVTAIEPFDTSEDVLVAALRGSPTNGAVALPDPLERAIADAAAEAGVDGEGSAAPVIDSVPFDSIRKRSATVVEDERYGPTLYVKGAPEAVLPRLAHSQAAARIVERTAELARSGARVLLIARRRGIDGTPEDEERDLVAIGALAFSDPPLADARASVEAARGAGIRTIMVTGDHPETALAVAEAVGIGAREGRQRVCTGADIDAAGDAELAKLAADVDVFARVVPEHKLRLVEALRTGEHVVAMTGDGVNDVPALRAADIGVAMGRRGTDAASEAADIVLADDDYSTIVAAVERGRAIYRNIRTFTHFLLATNAGEVLIFGAAITAGLGAPLTVIQILVVNLLTDGLPAVALAADPPDPADMRRRPRPRSEPLLAGMGARIILIGLATAAAAFAALLIGREVDAETGQTMAFTTLVASKLVYVFSARASGPAWRAPVNRGLVGAVLLSAAFAAAMLAVPVMRDVFGTAALSGTQVLEALALGLVPALGAELVKLARRRTGPMSPRASRGSMEEATP